MVENSTPSVRTWWQAKYFQIKLLSDRGEYELADTAIRSVKRTTDQHFDKGQFGFEEKLEALESELAKKVFDRPRADPRERTESSKVSMLSLPIALIASPILFPATPVPLGSFPQEEGAGDVVFLRERNHGERQGARRDPRRARARAGGRRAQDDPLGLRHGGPVRRRARRVRRRAGGAGRRATSSWRWRAIQSVLSEEELRPVIQQQALFYKAHAQLRLGQDDAGTTLLRAPGGFPARAASCARRARA